MHEDDEDEDAQQAAYEAQQEYLAEHGPSAAERDDTWDGWR